MPRFIQQEARPSGREKRLDQLGSLLALSQAAQAPQQQAQDNRMRMALSLIGLAQQGQEAEQQNAFRQQQLEQQKASEANRQGEYWGGQLPATYAGQEATDRRAQQAFELDQQRLQNTIEHQKAMEAIAQREADDASGYRWGVQAPNAWDEMERRKQLLEQQKGQQALSVFENLTHVGDPRAFSFLPPDIAAMDQPRHQAEVEALVQRHKGLMAGMPEKMRQQYLAGLNVHPDVMKQLMQQSVARPTEVAPASPTPSPAALPVTPKGIPQMIGPALSKDFMQGTTGAWDALTKGNVSAMNGHLAEWLLQNSKGTAAQGSPLLDWLQQTYNLNTATRARETGRGHIQKN